LFDRSVAELLAQSIAELPKAASRIHSQENGLAPGLLEGCLQTAGGMEIQRLSG
jgi:hypothetical protein